MLNYGSKAHLIFFMVLSVISILGIIAGTILSLIYDNIIFLFVAGVFAGLVNGVWRLLIKISDKVESEDWG